MRPHGEVRFQTSADPVSSYGFTTLALGYETCFVSPFGCCFCPCIHSHLEPSPLPTLGHSTPKQADLCVL